MSQTEYSIPFRGDGSVDVSRVRHDLKNSSFFVLEAKKILLKQPNSIEAKKLLEDASHRIEVLKRVLKEHGEKQ